MSMTPSEPVGQEAPHTSARGTMLMRKRGGQKGRQGVLDDKAWLKPGNGEGAQGLGSGGRGPFHCYTRRVSGPSCRDLVVQGPLTRPPRAPEAPPCEQDRGNPIRCSMGGTIRPKCQGINARGGHTEAAGTCSVSSSTAAHSLEPI